MVRAFQRLLLVIGLPLLALLVIEILLRVFAFGHDLRFALPDTIQGRPVYRDNPYFGLACFPEPLARAPVHFVAPRKKGSAFRVCVLGESAAMGDPEPAFGLSRMLEALLQDAQPGQPVEVINAAMTAINSTVIRQIIRDLRPLHPDLYVLYMGNNEVVGPWGPLGVLTPSSRFPRAALALRRTRLGQLLVRLVEPVTSSREDWEGLRLFTGQRLAADDPRLRRVYDRFARNLDAILAEAHAQGARVLLCTVPVNLDFPPFQHGDATPPWRLDDATGASRLPTDDASRWRALDQDQLRFRADSRLEGILRARATRADYFVDAVGELNTARFFYDHVHLNFEGTYALARKCSTALAAPATATAEDCALRVGFTPWSRFRVADEMYARLQRPPFPPSARPAPQAARPADLYASEARLREALEKRPGDWTLRALCATLLAERGDAAQAEAEFRKVLDVVPHHIPAHFGMARLLAGRGDLEAALLHFRKASLPQRAVDADAWTEFAVVLAERGQWHEAALLLGRALDKDPRHAQAHYNLGLVRTGEGDLAGAAAAYRAALALKPEWAEAENNLGVTLTRLGRLTEAADHFERALAINPAHESARANLEQIRQRVNAN